MILGTIKVLNRRLAVLLWKEIYLIAVTNRWLIRLINL